MAQVRKSTAASRLFAGYRPLPGVPDELVDGTGAMRPAWADLVAHLDGLKPAEIARSIARGEQYLRDAGVFFRNYGATTLSTRDWPLSPLPILALAMMSPNSSSSSMATIVTESEPACHRRRN